MTFGHDEWSAEQIQTLRRLWDEGLSASNIGKALRRSKNSIVGKAHRLGLPKRETFIGVASPRPWASPELRARRDEAQAKREARAAAMQAARPLPRPTPPPAPAPAPVALSVAAVIAGEKSAQAAREADRRADRPAVHRNNGPLHYPAGLPCQWPSGHPKTPGIRFECTAARVPERPYCAGHCAVAYQPRRQAVAA